MYMPDINFIKSGMIAGKKAFLEVVIFFDFIKKVKLTVAILIKMTAVYA